MTPRNEELHALSLDRSHLHEPELATAVCSCGAEKTVSGRDRKRQWEAAYDWHADHKQAVTP